MYFYMVTYRDDFGGVSALGPVVLVGAWAVWGGVGVYHGHEYADDLADVDADEDEGEEEGGDESGLLEGFVVVRGPL